MKLSGYSNGCPLFGLYGLSTRAWRAMIDELAEEVTEADKRMGINHPVIELDSDEEDSEPEPVQANESTELVDVSSSSEGT